MPRPTKVGLFYSGRGLKLRKYNHLGEKGELGKRNVAVLDRRRRGGGKVGREREKRRGEEEKEKEEGVVGEKAEESVVGEQDGGGDTGRTDKESNFRGYTSRNY